MPTGVTYQFSLTIDGSKMREQAEQIHADLVKSLSLPEEVTKSYDAMLSLVNRIGESVRNLGSRLTETGRSFAQFTEQASRAMQEAYRQQSYYSGSSEQTFPRTSQNPLGGPVGSGAAWPYATYGQPYYGGPSTQQMPRTSQSPTGGPVESGSQWPYVTYPQPYYGGPSTQTQPRTSQGPSVAPEWYNGPPPTAKPLSVLQKFNIGVEEGTREQWALRRVAYDLQYFGRQMTVTGAAGAAALGLLSNAYLKFDESATRAGMAMRLSADLQDEMREGALEASRAIGMFSPDEITEGLRLWAAGTGEVVQSESQLNNMLATTVDIQKLAAMNNVEFAGTVDDVGGIMHEFGLQASDVNRIVSVLNYTASESFANVSDMGSAFRLVGPLANQLNISLEDTASVLGALADQNIKSTMAGRAFRSILLGIVDPTDEYNKAMNEALGLTEQQGDAWRKVIMPGGKFIGINEFFETIAEATSHMTDAQRAQFAAVVTTNNATPSFIALLEEQSKVQEEGINVLRVKSKLTQEVVDDEVLAYKKWYEATTKLPFSLEGAFARMNNMWAEYEQSDSARMARLKRRYQAVLIDLGDVAANAILPPLEMLSDKFEGLADLLADHPGWANFTLWTSAVSVGTGFAVEKLGLFTRLLTDILILSKGINKAGGLVKVASAVGGAVLPAAATIAAVGGIAYTIATWDQFIAKQKESKEVGDALLDNFQLVPGTIGQWTAKTEYGKQLINEITGGTKTWINTLELGHDAWLAIENKIKDAKSAQEALSLTGFDLPTIYPLSPANKTATPYTVTPVPSYTDEQKSQMETIWKYNQDVTKTQADFAERRQDLQDDYSDWERKANADLYSNLNKMRLDYERSRTQSYEDHATDIARMQRDAQEDEVKEAQSHQDRMRKLELDHKDRMIDLLEERDVRGLVKEMRSYKRSKDEEQRSFNQSRSDRQRDTAQRIADAEADFQKEQQRKAEEYEQSRQDAIAALAKERGERQSELAKSTAELNKQESDALQELADSMALALFDLGKLLEPEYAGLLAQLDQFTELYTGKYAGLIAAMNAYNIKMAQWGMQQVEDMRFFGGLGAGAYATDYQQGAWMERAPTTATPGSGAQGMTPGAMFPGMSEEDLRQLMYWIWMAREGGELPSSMKLPMIPRQSGGYAESGLYNLGEGGREFVLSAPTTSILERRWGDLTQEKFLSGGDTISFSFNGMGREDRDWFRRETVKIVDGRLSQIHKSVAGAR